MDWAKDVQDALQLIPGIDKVEFIDTPTSTSGGGKIDLLDRWGLAQEDLGREPCHYGDFVPHPSSGQLKFEVRIPKSLRERFVPWESVHSETYEVKMWFRGAVPVCVITGNDPRDNALRIVPMVREFLKDEFSRRVEQFNGIEFEYLPPAPMHLRGYVFEDDREPDVAPEVSVIASPGYDRLELRVPVGQTEPCLDYLLESLVNEVALYYSFVADRNFFADVELVLEAYSQDVVSKYREPGIRAYMRRVFTGYRKAADLQIMAVEAEQARKTAVTRALRAREDQARLTERLILSNWIDAEASDMEQTSAPQIERMSAFVAAGTNQSVQTLAVLASAGLGGAIGAALTALLG